MKIKKLGTIISALGIVMITGAALWSCSNDDNFSAEPQVINQDDETTVRTLDRFSEIEPSFASFLMQSETRSTDDAAVACLYYVKNTARSFKATLGASKPFLQWAIVCGK